MATTLDIQIKAAIDTAAAAKNVKDLRKAIKDLNSVGLSLGKDQRKEFEKIAEAVGEARDRVDDLRDDMNAFQGSTVERLNASVNVLGEGFQNLDIDKIGAQFKNLGSIISANPLLFIAQIIIKLVENFDELAASGGLVGDIFKGIGDIVGSTIQLFKDLTDALGITGFAADESAQKQIDASERVNKAVTAQYEQQIRLQQAVGESTLEIEKLKIEAQRVALRAELDAIEASREATYEWDNERKVQIKTLDAYTKEQADRIAEIQIESNKLVVDYFIASENEKQKKLKESEDKRKKAYEEYLADEKRLLAFIRDNNIKQLDDERERLKQQLQIDQQEVNQTKASAKTKAAARIELQENLAARLIEIDKKEQDERRKQYNAYLDQQIKDTALAQEVLEDTVLTKKEYVEGIGWVTPEAAAKARANEAKIKEQGIALAFQSAQAIQQIENEKTARQTEANKKQLDFIDTRADRELASLQKRKDAELITQAQLDIAEAQLATKRQQQKEAIDKKQKALEIKAFKRNKAFQLAFVAGELAKQIAAIQAAAAANPANAATFGVAGLTQSAVLTALAVASSAIQAGTILAQKPPAFARGGIVTGAGTGTSDSITARLSNGESVINANSTQAFAPLLSAINQIGGGQSFLPESTSGTAGSVAGNSQPIIKTYVVESDITNSQKNASRTKKLSSI